MRIGGKALRQRRGWYEVEDGDGRVQAATRHRTHILAAYGWVTDGPGSTKQHAHAGERQRQSTQAKARLVRRLQAAASHGTTRDAPSGGARKGGSEPGRTQQHARAGENQRQRWGRSGGEHVDGRLQAAARHGTHQLAAYRRVADGQAERSSTHAQVRIGGKALRQRRGW